MFTHDRKCPQSETFLSLSYNQRKQRTLVNSVTVVTTVAEITIEFWEY
jgi:hypothetical protein